MNDRHKQVLEKMSATPAHPNSILDNLGQAVSACYSPRFLHTNFDFDENGQKADYDPELIVPTHWQALCIGSIECSLVCSNFGSLPKGEGFDHEEAMRKDRSVLHQFSQINSMDGGAAFKSFGGDVVEHL